MTITFRPYSRQHRAACERVFRSNMPRWLREHELPEFMAFLDTGECPYFVVEHAGQIVGCGGYGRRPGIDVADLCWGMVDRQWHGQGIGRQLLLHRLVAVAADSSFVAVRLGTSQLTEKFYSRCGFVTVERKKDGIAAGLDVVEMRLELTPAERSRILEGHYTRNGPG